MTQYIAPFIADDSDTARHLDHITIQVAKDRTQYAFDASRDSLEDDRTLGLTRVLTRYQQAAVALPGTLVHHRWASVRAEAPRDVVGNRRGTWHVPQGCTTPSRSSCPWGGATGSIAYLGL